MSSIVVLLGQQFLKGIYSQKVPDMEALTSELAQQTRHPPPGESSPAETPDIVVHEGSAAATRTGKLWRRCSGPYDQSIDRLLYF